MCVRHEKACIQFVVEAAHSSFSLRALLQLVTRTGFIESCLQWEKFDLSWVAAPCG